MTYKKPVPARWENSALIEQFVLLPPFASSLVQTPSLKLMFAFGFLRLDFVYTPRTRVESLGPCLLSTICQQPRSKEERHFCREGGESREGSSSSVGLSSLSLPSSSGFFLGQVFSLSLSLAFVYRSLCMTSCSCINLIPRETSSTLRLDACVLSVPLFLPLLPLPPSHRYVLQSQTSRELKLILPSSLVTTRTAKITPILSARQRVFGAFELLPPSSPPCLA